MEEQNPDGFPSHSRHQSPLHGFLGHQSHGPPGATFGRVTADHGDDALPLAVLQQRGSAGPLLLIKCPFESPLLVAMADLPNGLWSQRNNGGNPRRANAFRQLQQRHGPQDDPHLLHTATQQFPQRLLVLGCDFDTKGWTSHTPSMRQNISDLNCFLESFQAVKDLVTIDGVPQVLLLSEAGATSVALADGTLLWEHSWKGYPIVQPALTADGDVLISVSESSGTRRIAVARGPGGWTVAERWTSNRLKPYFNDFVVHNGHAFGFDGSILTCIDLKDGTRTWKGGRYGNGQLQLLADQDLLLVSSEEGELALVKENTDQFTELVRFKAIEGKTWNHQVLAGDVLLVRNGEEMAAFRLALAGR